MQQSQRSPQTQTPSRTPGRGGGGATGTGTASGSTGGGLQQALQLALAGDPSGLRDIAGRDPNFTATIDTMMASQVDQVMVGADAQGAIWGDVMTRASVVEEQRKVLPAGGAVEPVAESVTDTTAALPEAVEINDLGPVLPWGSVAADIEESSPVADNDRVAELLKPELGVDVSAQVVHIDREAWRVASTYNADAVVLDGSVFVHRRVEEAISEDLYGPVTGDVDLVPRQGGLVVVDWRPPFARLSGSEIVMTDGGYAIEMKGHEVLIYDDGGRMITRIWGDPHVDEDGDGNDDWHFGDDSTFILPDGTKVCCNTQETSPGVFYTVGVDVISGSDRFHYGEGGATGLTKDAAEWDLANADRAKAEHAGIFALQDNAQWAKQAEDGNFYDVNSESWDGYLATKDVTVDKSKAASGLTAAQLSVANDRDLKAQQAGGGGTGAGRGSTRRTEDATETQAWFAMQEVEVDKATGQVVDPLRYMPDVVRLFARGEPNYLPGIGREMAVSERHPMGKQLGGVLKPMLNNVDFSLFNVHVDPDAWKVAWAYNSAAVLNGRDLYVAQDIAEPALDELATMPAIGARGGVDAAPQQTRQGFLMQPRWRPPFLKHGTSDVLITPAGYTIELEMSKHEVIIYEKDGKVNTRIWGDPQVDEGGNGKDNWHFGNDSTFLLPDGTKICLDTKESSPGVFYTVGADVMCGAERFHVGGGKPGTMTRDAEEFDKATADHANDGTSGIFALQGNGQWAIQAADGRFYDIKDESWAQYLADKDVDFDPQRLADISPEVANMAGDADLHAAARKAGLGTPRPIVSGGRRYHRFEEVHVEAEVMAMLFDDKIVRRRR